MSEAKEQAESGSGPTGGYPSLVMHLGDIITFGPELSDEHVKTIRQAQRALGLRDKVERPPLAWTQKLVMAVGECISDQRNGVDVLASNSWDRVCELWVEQENRARRAVLTDNG